MPKPINPLSVLKPACEITTSAVWRLLRAKKHVKKLNDMVADSLADTAFKAAQNLENYLDRKLVIEKRLKNASNLSRVREEI